MKHMTFRDDLPHRFSEFFLGLYTKLKVFIQFILKGGNKVSNYFPLIKFKQIQVTCI